MTAADASLLVSLLAVGIALLSWREARRANTRGDRADINVTYGETMPRVSIYQDVAPEEITADVPSIEEERAHYRIDGGDVIEVWSFDVDGSIVMVEALWLSKPTAEEDLAVQRAVIDSLVLIP